jgi:hypothetical protein
MHVPFVRGRICKLLVLPLVVSYLNFDNAPAGPKHVGDIIRVQQLVYPSLSVHGWFALMKDKTYTVETRYDKRENSLCSLSVFTRLTADCMLVRFPYLLATQVVSAYVAPYFVHIINHFFGL